MGGTIKQIDCWRRRRWVKQTYSELFDSNAGDLNYLFEAHYVQQSFKHDKTTTVALIALNQNDFVIKRYNARNHWHKVKRCLRHSRARRCWKMSQHFSDAGLNVAPTILMQEQRWGPFRGNAYFINQHLNGVTLLDALPEMNQHDRSLVKAAVQEAFTLMEAHKLSHGDLKASNVIWFEGALYFIDLDAAVKHSSFLKWQFAHKKDNKRWMKNWNDSPELLDLFEDLAS